MSSDMLGSHVDNATPDLQQRSPAQKPHKALFRGLLTQAGDRAQLRVVKQSDRPVPSAKNCLIGLQ